MYKRVTLLGLVTAVAIAGCSSGSNLAAKNQVTTTSPTAATTSTVEATTTTLPPPNLKAEVLALSDMPTGWSVDNSSTGNTSGPKCFSGPKGQLSGYAHADADFVDGSNGVPALDEELFYVPNNAQGIFGKASSLLNGCGQVTFSSGGSSFSGTVAQMSFPSIGDQSAAWQVNLSSKVSGITLTVGVDLLLLRKADTIGTILYGDIGTPDVSTFQTFAQKAIAKVQ